MRVGTVRETKVQEFRVGLTPPGVRELVDAGHQLLVESRAGEGAGYSDVDYEKAGATVVAGAADVAADVDLLVKVKELLPTEFSLLRPGLILFTYLHLPNDPAFTQALIDARAAAIAYETVRLPNGDLPLLIPMSLIAGRMAAEIAAQYLKKPGPGRGKLLGGVPGVAPARAVVVGGGHVGEAATDVLVGLRASVTLVARDPGRLVELQSRFGDRIMTRQISPAVLREELAGADILVGGVRVPGGIAPKLVDTEMVRSMGPGAVIVDVGIDQGGICETSHPTTHDAPTFVAEGVIHYCVGNMPGAVPRTATEALTAATLPYVLALADRGLAALNDDPALAAGAAIINGQVVAAQIAAAQERRQVPLAEALVL
jgi:alanine dehydrogenase